MLKKNSNGLYQSTLFLSYAHSDHGFSTKILGDGRSKAVQDNISRRLSKRYRFQFAQQTHGTSVVQINKSFENPVANADGIITSMNASSLLLAVRVGDCVPLLFFDPKQRVVAAVHAGWRGTLGEIAKKTIAGMKSLGSQPENILVTIGPHIGMCHYHVPNDRAELFSKVYPNDSRVITKYNDMWYLDIGYANLLQLLDSGVLKKHVDAPVFCTYCMESEFYSYRRDTKNTFGEMLGVIAN